MTLDTGLHAIWPCVFRGHVSENETNQLLTGIITKLTSSTLKPLNRFRHEIVLLGKKPEFDKHAPHCAENK